MKTVLIVLFLIKATLCTSVALAVFGILAWDTFKEFKWFRR